MNNKGFTLIELIATISMLSILAIISFVSITGILKHSKITECETLVGNIKNATKEYVSDNRYSNVFNSVYDMVTIDASHLINGKYLSSPIVNPFTKEDIDPTTINIQIKLDKSYSVSEIIVKSNGNEIVCDSETW